MASEPRQATIAFVGIDGAGKTTQATRLAAWLADADIKSTYRLAATGRRVLSNTARRLGKPDSIALFGPRLALRAETMLRHANLSVIRQPTVLIADRYHICQYARTRMLCPDLEPWVRHRMRRLPRPDITLFFELPPQLAHERVTARGIDHESVDALTALDAAYRSLPEAANYTHIDAAGDADTVAEAVRTRIRSGLPELFDDRHD
ncbi:dTMP kinase [Stackebrandtia soli]|uniref:dTMP kinase n=1 Tax=Stackebrandtia soli TaxID=1892856 RepID=UPI0039E97049